MMAGSSLFAWLLLAGILGTATVAAALAALVPRLLSRLERFGPATRARVLTGLCLAPLAAGVALAGVCLVPSLYAALWPALDHCTRHADEHLHLCLVHPPAVTLGGAAQLVATGFVILVAVRAVPGGVRLARARRVLARLHRASVAGDTGVRHVDSDAAFSFAGGFMQPDIYLSRGLQERLQPDQLAAVIAHEQAHVRRRDLLRRHAARAGALVHGPRTAAALLAALDLACEEACDAEAADIVGDRIQVAQAIVAAARVVSRPPPNLAATVVGFTAAALEHRVTTLLDTPSRESASSRWLVVAILAALVALAPALHHATETVLSLLART